MNYDDQISQNQLNAYLDNELENGERTQVLTAIHTDKILSDELADLRQVNELVKLAYEKVPSSPHAPVFEQKEKHVTSFRIAAAISLLFLGSMSGWFLKQEQPSEQNLPFQTLAQLDTHKIANDRILIHINAMDDDRINQVLLRTDELLKNARKEGKHVEVEVVANASGLGMLRKGSPYHQRIKQIVAENKNVSFLACGFAMENARLKEGKNITLLPEARKVDAALEEILRRLKGGWLYVRG